jgi:hypothetical protein
MSLRPLRQRTMVASPFGGVDPQAGPLFDADHPRIEDPAERRRVLGYLAAGEPVLVVRARTDDVVDPARHDTVPLGFRTDGRWIWPDAVAYYLDHHLLAPDPRLLAHIRAADYRCPLLTGAIVYRARTELQETLREQARAERPSLVRAA